MSAQEVALAIGTHYGISVLVNGELADKMVTGRLLARSKEEAVESLSFLLGARWRLEGDSICFIGGRTEKKVVQDFPSYGLKAAELGLCSATGPASSATASSSRPTKCAPRRSARSCKSSPGVRP